MTNNPPSLELFSLDDLVYLPLLREPAAEDVVRTASQMTITAMRESQPEDSVIQTPEWEKEVIEDALRKRTADVSRWERYKHVELGFRRVDPATSGDWPFEQSEAEAKNTAEVLLLREAKKDVPSHPCHLLFYETSEYRHFESEFFPRILNVTLRGARGITFQNAAPDLNDSATRAKFVEVLNHLGLAQAGARLAMRAQQPDLAAVFR